MVAWVGAKIITQGLPIWKAAAYLATCYCGVVLSDLVRAPRLPLRLCVCWGGRALPDDHHSGCRVTAQSSPCCCPSERSPRALSTCTHLLGANFPNAFASVLARAFVRRVYVSTPTQGDD